eukprot:5179731-Prymnesium_polylepis.1
MPADGKPPPDSSVTVPATSPPIPSVAMPRATTSAPIEMAAETSPAAAKPTSKRGVPKLIVGGRKTNGRGGDPMVRTLTDSGRVIDTDPEAWIADVTVKPALTAPSTP